MNDRSKVLAVKVAMLLNCIAIVAGFVYLYQRTKIHRWDNSLVSIPIVLNFLLLVVLQRLEKRKHKLF